jgi:hypothetical protein
MADFHSLIHTKDVRERAEHHDRHMERKHQGLLHARTIMDIYTAMHEAAHTSVEAIDTARMGA